MLKLFHTIKYLKPIQIYYRLFYLLKKQIPTQQTLPPIPSHPISHRLKLTPSIPTETSYQSPNTFTFLSQTQHFTQTIDWNHQDFGKLWSYNLNYFEFLHQPDMEKEIGVSLIYAYINKFTELKDGFDPFPTSLRGINWIKFLTHHAIQDPLIDIALFKQYHHLLHHIEYHLLGNHLLENGFSLLYGAYYFHDEKLYAKAKSILMEELHEQILEDGGHFELSPMYHQIMLFRLLESINLIQHNRWKSDNLLEYLEKRAKLMLGWLQQITFHNGTIPRLNDSAYNIAPTTQALNHYAKRLNITPHIVNLSDSGYRMRRGLSYEMVIDIGQIGPDYIPGHAHSDTFNFELIIHNQPFIVDTGISTYNVNARRMIERSTSSHNTVELNGMNQSEVWGGFRVARRAYVTLQHEDKKRIQATHNGYVKRLGALHQRLFLFYPDRIIIQDRVEASHNIPAIARLHFHPDVDIEVQGDKLICNDTTIHIRNTLFELKTYQYAPQFNSLQDAFMVEISFTNHLNVEILL